MAGCLLPMFLADESSSSSSSNAAGFPPDDEEMMRSSSQTMKNKMSNFKNKLESYLPTETQNSNGPIFKNLENDHSVDERMGRISSPGFFKKKNTIIDPPAEFKNLEIDRDPSAAETRNEEPELPPATSIMMVVLAIVHFVLFVMACLDVKAWADTFGHR
ncbi:hypothetical protein B0H63DRAFT_464170 [Podospora didyma]|uniref:Uncharacterized protein n=1 Tax=Podospora didyma TaxID=330526 RepID=A0AAE0NXT7_9PEZI|nr:hypothetical protein B0H63DRAFT_464170 [Podospora didyma]